jgi:hypothetical protein
MNIYIERERDIMGYIYICRGIYIYISLLGIHDGSI